MPTGATREFDKAFAHRDEWLERVKPVPLYDHRFEPTSIGSASDSLSLYPGDVVRSLSNLVPEDTNVVVDSGAHRIFMAHYWLSSGLGNYFSSSALAPMGWAVAAGIGVRLGAPHRPCLVVTGDGCMLMHGMEMQTAARYGIKVIFIVLNNAAHGAIHIDAITKRTVAEQFSKLPRHDWTRFAQSVGVPARQVDSLVDLEQAVGDALACDGPFVIEVAVGVFPSPNRYYAESSTAISVKHAPADAFDAPYTTAMDTPECID